MRPRYRVVLATFVVATYWLSSKSSAQPVQSTTPFIAHIEKRYKKSDDDRRPEILRAIYARRSDGSFAQVFDARSPDRTRTEQMREIFDASKSQIVTLEPFTKSVMTMSHSPSEYRLIVNSMETENCVAAASEDSDSRFGKRIVRNFQRIPLPGKSNRASERTSAITSERYVVPELRCFAIRTIDRHSNEAVTEEEVTALQEGEPPEHYFSVPRNYVERSPRGLNEAYVKRFGRGHEFWPEAAVENLERRYQRLKREKEK